MQGTTDLRYGGILREEKNELEEPLVVANQGRCRPDGVPTPSVPSWLFNW